jgi:hypothetical protein
MLHDAVAPAAAVEGSHYQNRQGNKDTYRYAIQVVAVSVVAWCLLSQQQQLTKGDGGGSSQGLLVQLSTASTT